MRYNISTILLSNSFMIKNIFTLLLNLISVQETTITHYNIKLYPPGQTIINTVFSLRLLFFIFYFFFTSPVPWSTRVLCIQ
jgi:hypothetical protein